MSWRKVVKKLFWKTPGSNSDFLFNNSIISTSTLYNYVHCSPDGVLFWDRAFTFSVPSAVHKMVLIFNFCQISACLKLCSCSYNALLWTAMSHLLRNTGVLMTFLFLIQIHYKWISVDPISNLIKSHIYLFPKAPQFSFIYSYNKNVWRLNGSALRKHSLDNVLL